VLGIDTGMMLIAAENSRSNFVWDIFNQTSAARQSLAYAFPALAPTLLSAVSRKVRPNSSTADSSLVLDGSPSVEARSGGPTQLVLNFGANVVKGSSFSVTLTNASGGANGTVSSSTVSGSTLTINLSGVSDAQTLNIAINDVRHFSSAAVGNYTLSMDVLLADATQDASVNTLDFNVLAGRFGTAATSDRQGDFNFDAFVDSVDFNLLMSNYGKSIAAAAAPSSPISTVFGAMPVLFQRAANFVNDNANFLRDEDGSDLRIDRQRGLV